ncbi:hypothetical protein [Streptomyces bikiniensis]|nr:hypothetical protein [Streptomyces bikiniensis]
MTVLPTSHSTTTVRGREVAHPDARHHDVALMDDFLARRVPVRP